MITQERMFGAKVVDAAGRKRPARFRHIILGDNWDTGWVMDVYSEDGSMLLEEGRIISWD